MWDRWLPTPGSGSTISEPSWLTRSPGRRPMRFRILRPLIGSSHWSGSGAQYSRSGLAVLIGNPATGGEGHPMSWLWRSGDAVTEQFWSG
jgi:hypothetical protein